LGANAKLELGLQECIVQASVASVCHLGPVLAQVDDIERIFAELHDQQAGRRTQQVIGVMQSLARSEVMGL
jgi:hypothetical protein